MGNFLETIGYNSHDFGWKAQVKMLAQLVVIGAIMSVPMVVLMALAGWMETLCK